MQTVYRITDRATCMFLGEYCAETVEQAHEAFIQEAGYAGLGEAAHVLGKSIEQMRSELDIAWDGVLIPAGAW